jgi:dihydropteroate synthase
MLLLGKVFLTETMMTVGAATKCLFATLMTATRSVDGGRKAFDFGCILHGDRYSLINNKSYRADSITWVLRRNNEGDIIERQMEARIDMATTLPPTIWAQHRLEWGKQTHVMGIVNVTPDSFSGDGIIETTLSEETLVKRAVSQAQKFVAEGATLIDVGGESTRPNAGVTVSVEQELGRVLPVIRALSATLPDEVMISIDTYKAEVAFQALAAGASIVNDIWGLRHDPNLAAVVREHGVPVVLMANMRGYAKREIVGDVLRYLARSIDIALDAGIQWEHLIIDPGIGFGTTPEENLTLLRRLGELRALGRPLLLGVSRKSTIGRVLGGLPALERLEGTAASVALGIAQGADIVRVHDVHEMMRVVKMSDAIVRGTFTITPEWQ